VEDNFEELERVYDEKYRKEHGFWRSVIGAKLAPLDYFCECLYRFSNFNSPIGPDFPTSAHQSLQILLSQFRHVPKSRPTTILHRRLA
jgi:hypothetical protein